MSRLEVSWIGWSIVATGVLHCLVGLAAFAPALSAIAGDGVWNAVEGHPGRPVAFWFMMSGVCMILIGLAVAALYRARVAVPAILSWLFAVMVVVAVIALPASGAWLLVPAAIGLVGNALKSPRPNSMANPDPML